MQLKWCIKFTKPRKPAYVAVGGFCPPPRAFMCGWWFSMLKKADSVIYIGSVPVWYLHLGDITHSDPLATQPAVTAHLHTRVNAYRGVQHCRLL